MGKRKTKDDEPTIRIRRRFERNGGRMFDRRKQKKGREKKREGAGGSEGGWTNDEDAGDGGEGNHQEDTRVDRAKCKNEVTGQADLDWMSLDEKKRVSSYGVSVHILPGSIGLKLNLLILSGKDVVRIPKSTCRRGATSTRTPKTTMRTTSIDRVNVLT